MIIAITAGEAKSHSNDHRSVSLSKLISRFISSCSHSFYIFITMREQKNEKNERTEFKFLHEK